MIVRPANQSCWWCLAHKPSHGWWSDTKMMVGVAWAQTPFQRGRLTRLSVWGFVVQWSLCSWSFSCLHCVSDLTQVFVAGPAGYADCISQTYGLFHWLMHGHCLPGFWTRNPKIFEPMMLLLISKAVRLVGPWIPGAWFMLARLTVLPVWSISIHQISFGRCADRLLRSRMLCTCHRLCNRSFENQHSFGLRPMSLVCCACCFGGRSLVDPHGVFARIMARFISAYLVLMWHS